MDSSTFPSANLKVPEILDFTKYLRQKQNIYHRRLSVYTNIVPNPDQVHMNIALTKPQKYFIRDSPMKFLNGSKVEASILCSKYAQNFGIMGDVTVFPSKTKEMQHNVQLEMSTNGPLVRYTFMMTKDLPNDFVKDVSAQLFASGSCGLAPSTTIKQPFAVATHLWAPFPFVEQLRSHAFLCYGASPNHPVYTAGIGISTQINERARIDLNYCHKTGIQIGFGFDYAD